MFLRWTSLAVTVFLTVAAATGTAAAAGDVYRVAILTYAGSASDESAPPEAGPPDMPIKTLLAGHGYREGDNIVYAFRAGGRDKARTLRFAKELVAWKPDVIVSQMTASGVALKEATRGTDIPVVFWSTDPVEAGFVESYSRSGTNFTGFTYLPEWELMQLRLLKIVAPQVKVVGHLYNHTYEPAPSTLRDLRSAAELLGMEIKVYEVLTKDRFESTFAAMKADGVQGVVVGPHELFNTNGDIVGSLALKYGFPMTVCCQRSIVNGGAIGGYSPPPGWPAMAELIDDLLQGRVKPQDTPIQRIFASPLSLNLKAAGALGLTVPPEIIDEAAYIIR
ncbi:MAG: ABC transporter substrate-binding protein [Gammaproteobacteria bacterium]|nr:ABC transporter substrate-binding protein [Gammaproteobacteria bacterium]